MNSYHFPRLPSNQPAVKLQPVRVKTVADQAVKRETVPGSKINVEVAEDIGVLADPELLIRTFGNLLRNAVRYAGELRAGSRSAPNASEDLVKIHMRDCGPGVPDDPSESSSRPCDAWSIVSAWAANTEGCRYVTPATSSPSRMRDVTPASAASVVMPSNVSPGPSPYMGCEVVEAPGAVEAEVLGELHAADDLVPRHPLLRDIETETHVVTRRAGRAGSTRSSRRAAGTPAIPPSAGRPVRAVVSACSASISTGVPAGLGEQLRLARALHRDEPPRGLVDRRLADREQAVVRQDHGLVAAERVRDALALLEVEHDAGVVVEQRVVAVERARVLGERIERPAQATTTPCRAPSARARPRPRRAARRGSASGWRTPPG